MESKLAQSSNCHECSKSFGIIDRRYNCDHCKASICYYCSNTVDKKRTCTACYSKSQKQDNEIHNKDSVSSNTSVFEPKEYHKFIKPDPLLIKQPIIITQTTNTIPDTRKSNPLLPYTNESDPLLPDQSNIIVQPSQSGVDDVQNDHETNWANKDKCMVCDKKFGNIINRRHHCRECGRSICEEHSYYRLSSDCLYFQDERICTLCSEDTKHRPTMAVKNNNEYQVWFRLVKDNKKAKVSKSTLVLRTKSITINHGSESLETTIITFNKCKKIDINSLEQYFNLFYDNDKCVYIECCDNKEHTQLTNKISQFITKSQNAGNINSHKSNKRVPVFETQVFYKMDNIEEGEVANMVLTENALHIDDTIMFPWEYYIGFKELDDTALSQLYPLRLNFENELFIDLKCDDEKELMQCLETKTKIIYEYDVFVRMKNMKSMERMKLLLNNTSISVLIATIEIITIQIKQIQRLETCDVGGSDDETQLSFKVTYDGNQYVTIQCCDHNKYTELFKSITKLKDECKKVLFRSVVSYKHGSDGCDCIGPIELTESKLRIAECISFKWNKLNRYSLEMNDSIELQFNNDQFVHVTCNNSEERILFVQHLLQKTHPYVIPENEPVCIVCGAKSPMKLYQCFHIECKEWNKTVCEADLLSTHQNVNHSCKISEEYIICWNDKLEKHDRRTKFNRLAVKAGGAVMATVSSSSRYGYRVIATAGTVFAVEGGFVATEMLLELTLGAVGGGLVAAVIESIYLGIQMKRGAIKTKDELHRKLARCWAAGAVSIGVFVGCVVGTAAGPPGMVAGGFVGGIVFSLFAGLFTRYGVDTLWKKWISKPNPEKELQQDALKFFFDDRNFDVSDKEQLNIKIVRQKYHRLCMIYHPDRAGDSDEDVAKWLTLSTYYGVLVAIINDRNKRSQSISLSSYISGIFKRQSVADDRIEKLSIAAMNTD